MDAPDFNVQDVQSYLIEAGWPQFARFAYSHYRKSGKGAVVIDLKEMSDVVISNDKVRVKGIAEYKLPDELGMQGSDTLFNVYDAELEVAFVILHRKHPGEPKYDYLNSFTRGGPLSPRELFDRQGPTKAQILPFELDVVFAPAPIDFRDTTLQRGMINGAWLAMAPFAYKNFLEHGLGAVVIDLSKITSSRQFATTKAGMQMEYVALCDPKINQYRQEQIERDIRGYDPDREVIFLFPDGRPDDRGLTAVRVYVTPAPRPELSPRALHEVQKTVQ